MNNIIRTKQPHILVKFMEEKVKTKTQANRQINDEDPAIN